MSWAYFLGLAQKIGWGPPRFWASTMYEFTTACHAHAEMLNPKPREPRGADLAAFFRAAPGYRKESK